MNMMTRMRTGDIGDEVGDADNAADEGEDVVCRC